MFATFNQRSLKLERLDTGDYTDAEYAKWHREARIIHRVFGEVRALRNSLWRDMEASGLKRASILDVGAGSGELLRTIKKWGAGKELFLAGAEIAAEAAITIKRLAGPDGIAAVQCDALRLPFADDSFDYVFSTLFLHHLTDEQAVTLLREMGRVGRRKFFVIDLNRDPKAYYFYKTVSPLFFQRLTCEDGALSILRSFRPEEMRRLAEKAGFRDAVITRSRANRLILTGGKG